MLEAQIGAREGITVVELDGRLDINGALALEKKLGETPERTPDLVLDLAKVDFVSSAGIRVLVQLLKEATSHGGSVVLSGVNPAVRDILQITGMLGFFTQAASHEEAAARLRDRRRLAQSRRRITIGGIEYNTTTDAEADCVLQLWGPDLSESGRGPLFRVTLQELNLAFGLGGLGSDPVDALNAVGEFVGARNFVAIVPAGTGGLADCLIPKGEATSDMFVARAIGFSGNPRVRARLTSPGPVRLRRLISDAFELAETSGQAPADVVGFVIQTGPAVVLGGFYADEAGWQEDRFSDTETEASSTLIIGVAGRNRPSVSTDDCQTEFWSALQTEAGSDFSFHGHAVLLRQPPRLSESLTLQDQLAGIAESGVPAGLLHLRLDTRFRECDIRIFVPSRIEPGTLHRIKIERPEVDDWREEWDTITRRIYSDSARIVLKPLTGGFTSRTYRAESYDWDGRKQLPTVLKIGSVAVTEREVSAYRTCVEKFILNNSTTIMGTERCEDWAGLRYNFLGITGPDSRITWLENVYKERPTAVFLELLDRIFTNIFKPWYGQPRWEVIRPYADHDPRVLFDSLLEDAQSELGISPDDELLTCPPLGIDLPNPFRFLKHGYEERREREYRWYTGITHGDLNLKNILVDERDNVYIIDFSESRQRNVVSDFARLEPILKFELTRLDGPDDLAELLRFEQGLVCARSLDEPLLWRYQGSDPMVEKAYETICRLRRYADKVTLFETNLIPYLVAVLEWTLPVVSYRQFDLERKRLAAYSAGLITRQILQLEGAEKKNGQTV